MTRTCDGCTKCCEGWLSASAHGHTFYPGKPCHFLGKSCTIYKDRPENPCKSYKCEWLVNEDIPMWMKPDLCNVIMTKRTENNIEFYDLAEAGQQLDSAVLSWVFMWALNKNKNIKYQIKGGINKIGSQEFVQNTS